MANSAVPVSGGTFSDNGRVAPVLVHGRAVLVSELSCRWQNYFSPVSDSAAKIQLVAELLP